MMDAHTRLMQELYKAVREAGPGLSCTQLMRLGFGEIERLRKLRTPWHWIARRVIWVHLNGIGTQMPSPAEVEAQNAPDPSLSTLRAAYLRIKKESGSNKNVSAPEPGGAPPTTDTRTTIAAETTASVDVQDSFFDKLHFLKVSSP